MEWGANLAYAVGLIATDGCLSRDGRHVIFTSKDFEQVVNFLSALNLDKKIAKKSNGSNPEKKYFYTQFSDVCLYRFLQSIGLTPNKSKTIGELKIPNLYFRDFLRGHLDGDGGTYSYFDKRWKSSFLLYTSFCSASLKHIYWLRDRIQQQFDLTGKIKFDVENSRVYALRFAKYSSIHLLAQIYYQDELICLSRKKLKIERSLRIIEQQRAEVEELADSLP